MDSSGRRDQQAQQANEIVRIELDGPLRDKVQVAELFRSAYERLDRLSSPEVSRVEVVYREGFRVDESLGEEFVHAAREALAYQTALTFGRPVESVVIGLGRIADPKTRALVRGVYEDEWRRPRSGLR